MNNSINHGLSKNELIIILEILSAYKQQIDKVGILGSRSNGDYKEHSDIDLVLYGNTKRQDIDRLNTLFDESNPGLRVDIKAYHFIACPPLIKKHIDDHNKILFTHHDLL